MDESVPTKKVCCGMNRGECIYVVNRDAIEDAILNLSDEDLSNCSSMFVKTGPPLSIGECSLVQIRMICYRKLFRLLFGIGRSGEKVKLSSCVRVSVSELYSDDA